MRTRRRPVLQDKTPGNTPQKPKAKTTRSAKPTLVPVVEITTRPRRAAKRTQVEKNEPMDVDEADDGIDGATGVDATPDSPAARRTRQPKAKSTPQILPVKRGRGRPRKETNVVQDVVPEPEAASEKVDTTISVGQGAEEPPVEEHELTPRGRAATGLRMLPSPGTPLAQVRPRHHAPLRPIPPASLPVAQPDREDTPDSIPIADEDSTASEAVRAIMNTPSPARIFRGPIAVESTPLGRIPPLEQSLRAIYPRGMHDSSIRKWNAGVSRAYSPLPPSSPPPPSPPTQVPIASSSQPAAHQYRFSSDGPEEDQENNAGPVYVRRNNPSDADPFGLLAAEKKIKAMRQRRAAVESSRAPGAARAPLGTLALDEVPSSVPIPDRLPTPIPSDDDHNIDDLYLDVDPDLPEPPHLLEEEEFEDEDKENVPTDDYDLNEDKENMRPPHLVSDDYKENDPPHEDVIMGDEEREGQEDQENGPSVPPLLLASAKKHLDELLEQPSSSSASPSHALRTPHKPRGAHQRTPLPTPHYSECGLSDSPLTGRSVAMRNSSPSPIKPSVAARVSAAAKPKIIRQPLATLELEEPDDQPLKVAGKKRTRAQAEHEQTSEDSDPRAAVRKLEALLPKRSSKARATVAAKAARGKGKSVAGRESAAGKGKGKGKERENLPSSESSNSSDAENEDDSSPPRAPPARGRGRGAAAVRSRVRGRSVSRGRPASKGKGKGKAMDVDPEEDEERARQRRERLEYYRKLQEYSLEKEDVYVI
ncbi:hypothetical protein C8Q80DRAFT_1267902 [Daedaleopsis nitida]|nr:hypothetical protein C8Q80DRAFT_1267902 [Daedaleopsis nitida]